MAKTEVHLKGLLEPLVLNEPWLATMMNMNAAMNNGMVFFQGHDEDDDNVVVSIPNVIFMRGVED